MKGYLVLENGSVFEGETFGYEGECFGEVVFTTGMVGYVETLTDPANQGKIVVQTFPLNGNYGIMESDFESDCVPAGYVVREWCKTPSNFRTEYDVNKFLTDKKVVGICGVDTREITRQLRENGEMKGIICNKISEVKGEATPVKAPLHPPVTYAAENAVCRLALLDLGVTNSVIKILNKLGAEVTSFDINTQIDADKFDGCVISAGAENLENMDKVVSLVGELYKKLPLFAMGVGHQALALSQGARLTKMKQTHRGANAPVKMGNRTYITTQNHGYAVEDIKVGEVVFENVNDKSIEGIKYEKSMSVQFIPDSSFTAEGTAFIYKMFIDSLKGGQK